MLKTVPDILAQIVDEKRRDLLERRPRPFREALLRAKPAIIAEIKKASPSKGVLSSTFSPAKLAQAYEAGGAAALSVLTDEKHFQGSLNDLLEARKGVTLPVLRKDFTIDHFHVIEAAAHGADAILLIAAILSEKQLRDFRELADRFGLASVVEVHDREELDVALASGADIVGVNNRDLHTFAVDLKTSLRLAEHIPSHVLKISESGIHSKADVTRLAAAGFDAFLVGEHLMRSANPAAALRELLG